MNIDGLELPGRERPHGVTVIDMTVEDAPQILESSTHTAPVAYYDLTQERVSQNVNSLPPSRQVETSQNNAAPRFRAINQPSDMEQQRPRSFTSRLTSEQARILRAIRFPNSRLRRTAAPKPKEKTTTRAAHVGYSVNIQKELPIVCPACEKELVSNEDVSVFATKCGHVYCSKCAAPYRRKAGSCVVPHCGARITRKAIFPLYF
ncbi:SUMO-targeted ubiquitin-protein ligase subunit Rfp2 [Schizosaccharomyces japonicus yFS275]|uniref:SUMO-targeted ubiquitin-protein ligase subunit Rfp2 n=1 Tax=Schizosaccharomyces japonicus (strain yFS275 / FY16936) TaxID=402676 RepID=B6JYB1_SCHJY|nr:SUMO-targeted ubiquitin-protein ligase subunit Rfp2 [Schizosaccharomyces japonicus yFS275]EEB06529.1 SUMO-targeted ubiquitin-protein ligase subunit Rfp2 [Schizosaccharomyces japonicus yFS275]